MFCECLFAFSYLQNIRRYQQKNVHRSTQKALRNSPEGFDAAKQNLCNLPDRSKLSLSSVGNPCTTVDFVAAYRKNSYIPYHAQEYMKIVKDFT